MFNSVLWMNQHLGKFLNPDGAFDFQCVDVFKQLCADIGMPNPNRAIGGDGYAHYIWYNRDTNGYTQYFDAIDKNHIQVGDVVIFGKGGATPYSHVGMCYGWNSNGSMKCFGQNQGGASMPGKLGSACNVISLPTATLLGGLRVKASVPKKTVQTGKLVWNFEAKLNIGDTVSSCNLTVDKVFDDNTVTLKGIDGRWNASELTESEKTKDGKNDQILHPGSVVYFTETEVQDIDEGKNIVKINGHWMTPEILCRKEYR